MGFPPLKFSAPNSLISQAAADLAIQSEVESTLAVLLRDVEHAHNLELSLHAHNALNLCREQLAALRVRYDDREAAWVEDRNEKERLGVLLLEDVVKLSALEVKGETRTVERRQLECEKTEDEKKFNRRLQQQQHKEVVPAAVNKDKEVAKEAVSTKNAENNPTILPEPSAETPHIQGESQIVPDAALAATLQNNSSNQSFAPHNLDETTLMTIFAFLDPLDVMNFAQANKALLGKVNVMFGTGGGDEKEETNPSGGDAASPSVETTHPPPLQPQVLPASEAQNLAFPSLPEKSSGATGVSGPTHKRSASGVSVSTVGSGSSANPFSTVSSWFSSTDNSSVPVSTTSASAKIATAPPTEPGSEIKLNAAMANSMALKLTPAELSVIVQMRKNLQKCEADANKWRLEKEDAVANLANVEAVKEFLVTKVRDSERVVQLQKEEMKRVQKKNLEDQEVIVFLDEKVKELEKACDEMKLKEAISKKEHMDMVNKNEQKSRVLADMLAFEREQMVANEKEWKAAKKVLVKEVKNCRARIVALKAEGNGYRQQNTQLKSGLIGLTHSGGSSPGGKKYYRSNG